MVHTKKHSTKVISGVIPLLAILSAVLFNSCKQTKNEYNALSPEFAKIADTTNKITDRNPERAIKYLDSAYKTLKTPTTNDAFRKLAYHYVLHIRIRHDAKKALLYADSMLNFVNENGGQQSQPSLFSEANFAKGDAYFELQDYTNAYPNYFIGYKVGKNHLDKVVLSVYNYRMGMITYQQTHYNLAINYFKDSFNQGIAFDKDFVIFYRDQELLDNIGLAYRHLDKADSALFYFNKTLAYLNKKAPGFPEKKRLIEVARAVANGNKADIYIKRHLYDTAIYLLKQSIATTILKGNDNYDALQSEIKLANIYVAQHQQKLLVGILDLIHNQLKYINNKNAESEWNRLMSDYYAAKNQPAVALVFNKRYNTLKDSLIESTRLLKESNVSEQLNNYEKEHEIKNLTSNNKIQLIYLNVVAVFAIMSLAIIFLIYRNWKRSKKDLVTVNLLNEQVTMQKSDLEKTLAKLNESSQEKDRILHTVAHDLRNPLGGIASLTNAMTADDDYTEEQKEYVTIIKETADNSLELINEILEATDNAVVEIRMQPVDINLLINNSVELLRFKAAEKNQQINLVTLDTPEMIMISREKIWRVISNLIINAIKFSPVGATINVQVVREPERILLMITDNGIGIPDDLKHKVFNMFTDAKRLGTMGEKSFGLGLSICQQIVDKHNGEIWFESTVGNGTTFFVSLNRS